MIGFVDTGQSFLGCISYDLEDKQELTDEQKERLSLLDKLQHKNRAEVLAYNRCFGDKYELAAQFREVALLSRKIEKPVFHFALRLAPGDTCSNNELVEMGEACAKEFGVEDNQYLIILHKDTNEPHIHIVANRVGYDGKVASDSNSYRRMAALCRRLEKQYNLTEVLNPRAFLSQEQRLIPRQDKRKECLKKDIRETLEQVSHYPDFVQKMAAMGYQIIKGRGIVFIDDKKVRIKGSEVGFSLAKIEQIFRLKQELAVGETKLTMYKTGMWQDRRLYTPTQRLLRQTWEEAQHEIISELKNQVNSLLYDLFKPEYTDESINPELMKEARRKKKRRPQR